MFTELFGEEIPTDFRRVTDVLGEEIIGLTLFQMKQDNPDVDVDRVQEVMNSIYIRVLNEGEESNLPQPGPGELVEGSTSEVIDKYFVEAVLEYSDMDKIPNQLPVMQIADAVFAIDFEKKEDRLQGVMDWLVEQENYEEAAQIRDMMNT